MNGVGLFRIPDRVALVTAASEGIGRAAAEGLAAAGARVAILSRDPEKLSAAARGIEERTGVRPLTVRGDLLDPATAGRAVAEVAHSLGPVEILVANVGGPPGGAFDALDDADWDKATAGVLGAAIRLVRAVLPAMRRARFGRIVHVLSTTARAPLAGLTTSNALRPAVAGLIADLARENAIHRITVNGICPGYTRTARLLELGVGAPERLREFERSAPIGRLADPAEIAAPVVFLASDAASYITGAILPVDGGLTARVL